MEILEVWWFKLQEPCEEAVGELDAHRARTTGEPDAHRERARRAQHAQRASQTCTVCAPDGHRVRT